MARLRLISSDSIDFGLESLQSDYLDELLKDIPLGEAVINVPFTSYTVLGFLKDVNCLYQNDNVLELRKLLGLRSDGVLDQMEEESSSYTYNIRDETENDLDETQYMVKIELESIASNSSVNHFDLSDLELTCMEELTRGQETNSGNEAEDQTEVTENSLNQPVDEVAIGEIEANRDESAQEDLEAAINTELAELSVPQEELLTSDHSMVDPVETVPSLHEDDITSDGMGQDEIISEVSTDGVSNPEDVVELQRKQKLRVRFVSQGLENIEDIPKAKSKKRKRGNK